MKYELINLQGAIKDTDITSKHYLYFYDVAKNGIGSNKMVITSGNNLDKMETLFDNLNKHRNANYIQSDIITYNMYAVIDSVTKDILMQTCINLHDIV